MNQPKYIHPTFWRKAFWNDYRQSFEVEACSTHHLSWMIDWRLLSKDELQALGFIVDTSEEQKEEVPEWFIKFVYELLDMESVEDIDEWKLYQKWLPSDKDIREKTASELIKKGYEYVNDHYYDAQDRQILHGLLEYIEKLKSNDKPSATAESRDEVMRWPLAWVDEEELIHDRQNAQELLKGAPSREPLVPLTDEKIDEIIAYIHNNISSIELWYIEDKDIQKDLKKLLQGIGIVPQVENN